MPVSVTVACVMSAKNRRTNTNVISKMINSGKRAVAGVLSFVMDKWNSLQRETKKVLCICGVTGILLISTVLILAIRLGSVTKELKSVQAMSERVQSELETVKAEAATDEKLVDKEQEGQATVTNPAVTPDLLPSATPEPEMYVVCVDAGHGDWDGGAVKTENGVEVRIEKDDNLWMAKLFRDALEAYGIEVVMTRETDVYLGLSERARIANAAGADVMVSFHRNSYEGTDEVRGIEFWIHNSRPEGAEALAQSMLDEVVKVGGLENRGVKYGTITSPRDNYAINREANMTSMIIEMGFVSSDSDNSSYDAYGKAYAQGMARAVFEWLEGQER